MAKPPWEEHTDEDSHTTNEEADAAVEIGQHGHDLVNLLMVVFLQGLVEKIGYADANTKFRNTEERHDIDEHACQTDELVAKTFQEYATREEREDNGKNVE